MKGATRNGKGIHIVLEVTNKAFITVNFIHNDIVNICPNASILAVTKTFCQFFEIIDLNHTPYRLILFSFNAGLFKGCNVLKVQSHDCMFSQFIFTMNVWSRIARIDEFIDNLEISFIIFLRHIPRFAPDFIDTESRQ